MLVRLRQAEADDPDAGEVRLYGYSQQWAKTERGIRERFA